MLNHAPLLTERAFLQREHQDAGPAACARRTIREETGMDIDPCRCAFVLGAIAQLGERRVLEVVFLSPDRPLLIAVAYIGRGGYNRTYVRA
jgi:ADP-ribose pyrophosphatase YjhB (NUDIX family)